MLDLIYIHNTVIRFSRKYKALYLCFILDYLFKSLNSTPEPYYYKNFSLTKINQNYL